MQLAEFLALLKKKKEHFYGRLLSFAEIAVARNRFSAMFVGQRDLPAVLTRIKEGFGCTRVVMTSHTSQNLQKICGHSEKFYTPPNIAASL